MKKTTKTAKRGRRIAQDRRSPATATRTIPPPAITAAEGVAHNREQDRIDAERACREGLIVRAANAARHRQAALMHLEMADARDSLPGGGHTDRTLAALENRKADVLEELPAAIIHGTGGEVALAEPLGHDAAGQCFKDTLKNPTTTGVAASRARMELAADAGSRTLAMAMDAAETLGASNSLEKMATHQLAACHGLAMRLLTRGEAMIGRAATRDDWKGTETFNVEGCRLIGAATRLLATYQAGLATLARIRQGGKQVVTVQHVNVNDGGQAVVAGNVGAPGGGGLPPGEGERT